MNIFSSIISKMQSISLPSIRGGVWGWGFILCVFAACLAGCRTTRQTQSSESESNAVSQAQWRHSRDFSADSFQRLTALSFDSCAFTFGGPEESETPQGDVPSYPSGKPPKSTKAMPSSNPKATPSKVTLYGLHLSHSEKKETVAAQADEDSLAASKQSSSEKSQTSTKSKTSVPFTAKLAIAVIFLLMAAAILMIIRRRSSGKRTQFGSRLPHQ